MFKVQHIVIDVYKIHFFFLFILTLNYLIPYLVFGKITLFYADTLDGEIPYNLIIGKYLKGDLDSIKVFLNGQLNFFYLRRIFSPYSYIYSFLNLELAYWTIDILVKSTSYISFFILAKKINKNLFFCGLISCLFASSNLPTHEGFGLAIFPYLIYLIIYKNKFRLKHYILVIFFGLNSDFIFTAIALPSLSLTILLLKRDKILNLIKILSLFFIALVIANINLLIVNFQNITFHREEFVRLTLSFKESLFFFINNLISLPLQTGWAFFKQLPLVFYKLPIICLAFFSKDKNVKRILLIVVLTSFTLTLISNKFFGSFINDRSGFIRTISWSYILNSYYILYCLIGIFILKKINFFNNILIIFIFISLFLFQINSSIVPFAKKIIFKEKKYQNLYTFKEYYYFYNYEKIKQIVGTNKVMSIGLDPMVATVHGIYVIDGYYSLYPLEYKKRFREIIEEELNINPYYKKYFDEWGSKLYSTLYRPKNIDLLSLNYDKAKNIGAKYIISSLKLNSEKLELIYGNCDEENFCLYKIK